MEKERDKIGVEFGKRLKELRTNARISQNSLGEAIGVNKRAIIFWEQGINEPKASYIARIALFFDVSADFLLGLSEF